MPLDTNCKHTDSMHPLEHVGPRVQAIFFSSGTKHSKAPHTVSGETLHFGGSGSPCTTGTHTFSNSGWSAFEVNERTASVLDVPTHLGGTPAHMMESVWLSSQRSFLQAIKCHKGWELGG